MKTARISYTFSAQAKGATDNQLIRRGPCLQLTSWRAYCVLEVSDSTAIRIKKTPYNSENHL